MASTVVLGSISNPGTGVLITGATTGTVLGGVYQVTVTTQLSGTTVAADLNNMQLQVGATVIGPLLTVIPTATGAQLNPTMIVTVPPGGAAITVNCGGGTSGASAVYKALMVVTTG